MGSGKEGRWVLAAAVLSCLAIAFSWYTYFLKEDLAAQEEQGASGQNTEKAAELQGTETETEEPKPADIYSDSFTVNYETVRKTVGMEEPQISETAETVYSLETVTPFSYGISAGSGDFSYCYPTLLYSHVETVFEEELLNSKSETVFTSDTDGSRLAFVYQTNSSKNHAEIKEIFLEKARETLSDVQVVADASDSDVSRYYVTGREGNLVVWELTEVIAGKVYQMILKYPEPADEEDARVKAYYADCLYRLCGFSGQKNRTQSWESFEPD